MEVASHSNLANQPEFIPIEYVELDGRQWIDLGVVAQLDMEVSITYQVTDTDKHIDQKIFGYALNWDDGQYTCIDVALQHTEIQARVAFGNSGAVNLNFTMPFQKHTICMNQHKCVVDDINQDWNATSILSIRNLCLGSIIEGYGFTPRTDYPCFAKIFEFKLSFGGKTVFDFKPCIKDGIAQFYNAADGTFWRSQSGTDFLLPADERHIN